MTSSAEAGARRGVVMVGPPYLYRGSQLCGKRTGRTCIFFLASFGVAFILIGLVLFTADLSMQSGMWAAGMVFMAFGVVLLGWFVALCCSARSTYYALPTAHPERAKTLRPILNPVATSTPAYQLLPLTQNRNCPQGQSVNLVAGQTLGYMNQPGSYMNQTGPDLTESSIVGQRGSYVEGQRGSYVELQSGNRMSQSGIYMGGQRGSYVGEQRGSYVGEKPGSYMGGQRGSYLGELPGNYIGRPSGRYLDVHTGSYLGGQAEGLIAEQEANYNTGIKAGYNETWGNSLRKFELDKPKSPQAYTLERNAGYPTQPTWECHLGHAQGYHPSDVSNWSSLARSSPRLDHPQEYLANNTRTYRPEQAQGTFLPGVRHSMGYSSPHMGTLDQRQIKPEDHPPPYCDVVPY